MSGLFGSQTMTTREERISGIRLQTSAYGVPIPIYYGDNRAVPNILWYGDFQAIEHRSEQDMGGKGGGGVTSVNISYTYQAAFILGLGEGPLTTTHLMPNTGDWKAPSEYGCEEFTGTAGQGVWGHLSSHHADTALGYSGTAYLAAAAYSLGGDATLPNFSVQITGQHTAATRLARYIEDFLTSPRYGAGFPMGRLAGLDELDAYLASQDVTFSPPVTEQQEAAAHLRAWCDAANCEAVWSEGLLKFRPRQETMAVAAALGLDDFLARQGEVPLRVIRSPQSDASNQVQVEYLDAANHYNVAVAEAKDLAGIAQYGVRAAPVLKCHQAKSAAAARWVAQHRLQRALYVRNRYEFRLDWKHGRLEPMDLVTLTEPRLGLDKEPALIIEVSEDENGLLSLVAEEYNGAVSGVLAYPTQAWAGATINTGIAPGAAAPPVIFEPPAALAGSPQLWLATSGGPEWGGCEVWASFDDASYRRIGTLAGKSRHGSLRAALASGASPDTVNTLAVHLAHGELAAGTTQNAADLLTLCYVDGEYLAYRDATLVAAGDYDLAYLVRGAYGSAIAAHAAGAPFVRCDEALFKLPLTDIWTGRLVYIKLLSYNLWGGAKQALSDVEATTYTVSGFPVVTVYGLVGTVFQTSAMLEWAPVATPTNYARIEILRSATTDPDDAVVIAVLAPTATRYTDTLGVSGATRQYWLRLVGHHEEAGPLSAMVSLTTLSVGGIAVTDTQPGAAYLGQDVVYYNLGEDLWEWDGAAYQRAQPVVNASQINAASLSAISGNLGTITAGSLNIANKFRVNTDGTMSLTGSAGTKLAWNGTSLAVAGSITVESGSVVDYQYVTGAGRPADNANNTYVDASGNLQGVSSGAGTAVMNAILQPSIAAAATTAAWSGVTGAGRPADNADVTQASLQVGTTITGGGITLSEGGAIQGGQTDFNTGVGWFLGYSAGGYRFSIGNPAGNRLTWDGAALTFTGALNGATGTFSGALNAATGTFSGALNAASGTFAGSLTAQTVTTANIVSNAISDQYASFTAGLQSFSSTSEVAVAAIGGVVVPSTASAARVVLDVSMQVQDTALSAHAAPTIRVRRNGVTIATYTLSTMFYGGSGTTAYQQWSAQITDAPGVGTYTYDVTFQPGNPWGSLGVENRNIQATVHKR